MEQKIENIEKGVGRLETRVGAIEDSLGRIEKDLGEFIAFTKTQFEKQENRLENIGGTMQEVQRAFLFKAF